MESPAATTGLYCKACGYDLRASKEAGRCPECGRAFSPGDPKSFYPRPFAAPWKRALGRWAKRFAILLLVLGVLLAGVWGWYYWGWRQEQAAVAEAGLSNDCNWIILGGKPGEWLHRRIPGAFVLVRVNWVFMPETATDSDLGALRKLRFMRGLELSGSNISDAGMANLRGLPRLHSLSLWKTGITDAGLEPLRDLPGLQGLIITDVPLTDAGWSHLGKLPRLVSLELKQMPLTDAGLVHLKSLPQLKWLSLQDTQVTDAGLVDLEKRAGLEWLNLTGTKVTPAGAERLRAALPGCTIEGP